MTTVEELQPAPKPKKVRKPSEPREDGEDPMEPTRKSDRERKQVNFVQRPRSNLNCALLPWVVQHGALRELHTSH